MTFQTAAIINVFLLFVVTSIMIFAIIKLYKTEKQLEVANELLRKYQIAEGQSTLTPWFHGMGWRMAVGYMKAICLDVGTISLLAQKYKDGEDLNDRDRTIIKNLIDTSFFHCQYARHVLEGEHKYEKNGKKNP